MDRSAVSRIENKERAVNDIEFTYLCKALRLSPERFLFFQARLPTDISFYEELAAEEDDLEIRVAEDEPL
jgi:hypothetical protein